MTAIPDLFSDLTPPETPVTSLDRWATNATHFFGFERLAPGPMTPTADSVASYVYDSKYDLDVRAAMEGFSLGLVGPTGVGKTSFVRWLAHQTGHEYDEIVHGAHFEASDALGDRIQDADGRWIYGEGRLTEAYRLGRWVLLDELAAIKAAVAQIYHPFIQGESIRMRRADGTIQIINRHPNFRLAAAWNPLHGHGGNHEIGFALMDRFLIVYFDAIDYDKEVEALVAAAPSIGRGIAEDLAAFAATWRKGAKENPDTTRYSVSTRTLLDIVALMERIDAPIEYAVKRKIFDPVAQNFPDEAETVRRVLTSHITLKEE
jgi:MoxR-like ATPase